MGFWVTRGSHQETVAILRADRDDWHAAYTTERSAHDETKRALATASDRADAAVENAAITRRLLEEAERRSGRALEA